MSTQVSEERDEQLMTINQFAAKLNVHPESARRWLRKKRMKGLKAGNRWRIAPSEIGRIRQEGGL